MNSKSCLGKLDEVIHHSHSILEAVNSGIVIYEAHENGSDFTIFYINSAVEKIEKLQKEKIVGKRVSEVFKNIKEFGLFDVFLRV